MDEVLKHIIDDACKEIVMKAEKDSFIVCAYIPAFDDDVWDVCSDCGVKVCHRPYVPMELVRICIACFVLRVGHEGTIQ